MATGIRAEVSIGDPGACPIARASGEEEARIDRISRAAATNSDGRLTEEFALEGQDPPDFEWAETVMPFGDGAVVRFERERNRGCVCDRIERHGCPVEDIRAEAGTLAISFFATDVETVRAVVEDLQDGFEEVNVRHLARDDEHTDRDVVPVDRNRLTARQREVLETSLRMGYFDHPKGANAGDVADELGIAPSTYSEHLAAAQRKLFEAILRSP